ncbi:MAG: hypothetical protein WAP47_08850 [Candidatus Rokuibacteriota bacterium]
MVLLQFHNWKQEAPVFGDDGRNGHRIAVISTLRDRTPVPQPKPLDEGQAKWGKPSQFSWGSNKNDFDEGIIPSTTWEFDDNPENPEDPEDPNLDPLTDEWTEVDRKETTVRIDGPEGAYVDFARIDEVKFKVPNLADGREHFIVLKFKTSGDEITPKPPGLGSGGSGASETGIVPVGSDEIIRDPDGGGASL